MARSSVINTSKGGMTPKSPRPRDKPSKYLEQKDATLELAASIAEGQEDKVRQKVEKNRLTQALQADQRQEPEGKDGKRPKTSSKAKLKEKKTALAAQRLQSKKEKANARKQASRAPSVSAVTVLTDSPAGKSKKKSVSFG